MKREKKKQRESGARAMPAEPPATGEEGPAPSGAPVPAEKKQAKPDRERSGEGSGQYTLQPGMIGTETSGLDGIRILQAIAVLIATAAIAFMIFRII